MPRGIPVATMAIGKAGSANAALFAAAILALKYPIVQERLSAFRAKRRKEALDNQIP
jgi:5-(carboxyamino)imidazole ribonucleotide mutase